MGKIPACQSVTRRSAEPGTTDRRLRRSERCGKKWPRIYRHLAVFIRVDNRTIFDTNNTCKVMSNRTHRGSDFRDFLKAQSVLEEVEARALKQVISLQLRKLLNQKSLTKAAMARRMRTSRAALDRLLDATNTSVTLTTLGKAARALGRKVKIELVPA